MNYSDKNLPDLTKTELQILNVIWKSKEGLSIREVHSEISQKNKWAYSTTKTTMDRMAKKGLLERGDFHGVYLYQAKVTRPVGLAKMVSYFFNDVLEFDTRSIVAMFVCM